MGCIMMRKCHLNTCPVGICTQDDVLRRKFAGTPEHVLNYLFLVAEELRSIMSSCGVRTIDELVGRTDLLEPTKAIAAWKAQGLDLTALLHRPEPRIDPTTGKPEAMRRTRAQDHGLEGVLDHDLIKSSHEAIEQLRPVVLTRSVRNTDRAVGTMLSHTIAKRYGLRGLPDDTLRVRLNGSAGQSLGAFLAAGVTIEVHGDANDYVGKGLSGGRVVVRPPANSLFLAEEEMIVGNVALYGATGGEAYFRGRAAERFAVRNSGACAVVEGVGDHGCEYMTRGRVAVLGPTGRNFAAGMSGGIAFVWDPQQKLALNCNLEMVTLESLHHGDDVHELLGLLRAHWTWTQSTVARHLLDTWHDRRSEFRMVYPMDYRRVRDAARAAELESPLVGGVGHA
jgi:glutamate synthase (NADPH/NADH) large chain